MLEAFDLREAGQERALLVRRKRLPEPARLDRLTQPDALRVVGDVLDLVRARPAVDLAQVWESIRERLARNVEAEEACGDPGL